MFVHSRGEIKSTIVSDVYELDNIGTNFFRAVPPVISHSFSPVCAFVQQRSCDALSSIRFLWEDPPLVLAVEDHLITGLHE